MVKTLSEYFPMIREEQEILEEIEAREELRDTFYGWSEEQQREFLDLCTGVRGAKILRDAFFKEVMNPETAPWRLNELLSLLLGKEVTIVQVLPNDSTRIADESSLLITDIVVELKDGSLANVEIQRLGYAFPGQRSACYSADLLLRQYKRVKGKSKKKIKYKDIKSVYTIVFFEKSPKDFKKPGLENAYIHHMKQRADTGLELDLLQEFIFVPLDIYRKTKHNIDSRIDLHTMYECGEGDGNVFKGIAGAGQEYGAIYDR